MKSARPTMLSHVAYVTHDTAATAQFYSDVLGMELVNAVLDDSIPSTGDAVPYFHSFFRMADGSTVAFFEAPELPPEPAPSHPAYDIFRHLAMQVDTTEEVDGWRDWLVENGVDVLGPVDHKIVYSIYFHDPNGNRLEITAPVDPDWNNMGERARESLAEWEQVKATARARAGGDMATVLKELTVERSHRRAAGLQID